MPKLPQLPNPLHFTEADAGGFRQGDVWQLITHVPPGNGFARPSRGEILNQPKPNKILKLSKKEKWKCSIYEYWLPSRRAEACFAGKGLVAGSLFPQAGSHIAGPPTPNMKYCRTEFCFAEKALMVGSLHPQALTLMAEPPL